MVISMDRWKGKVAVVTGASAGIGAAIVEQLVEAGLQVAGLARRQEKVEELQEKLEGQPGKLYAIKADVTNEEDILDAFKWIKENMGPVHVLVNNAGISRTTSLVDGNTQFWREIFDTNVLGLCVATREAIRDMRANEVDGHIFHINSIAGHSVPNMPGLNVYPASKHAVTALTETLRLELNSIESKIRITSVSPGLVRTEMFDAISKASNVPLAKEFGDYINAAPALESSDIADAVIYALSTPAHVQIHELTIHPVGEKY